MGIFLKKIYCPKTWKTTISLVVKNKNHSLVTVLSQCYIFWLFCLLNRIINFIGFKAKFRFITQVKLSLIILVSFFGQEIQKYQFHCKANLILDSCPISCPLHTYQQNPGQCLCVQIDREAIFDWLRNAGVLWYL